MYLLPDFTLETIYACQASSPNVVPPDKIQFCTVDFSQKTQWNNVQWDWFLFHAKKNCRFSSYQSLTQK